jgi:signal transduction histidine kinase
MGSERARTAREAAPFALATAFVFLILVLPIGHRVLRPWQASIAFALALAIGVSVVMVPWRRLPRATFLLPIFGSLAVVGLLRDASGASVLGFGGVAVLIPLLWAGLYLGMLEVLGAVVGIALLYAIPILTVGAPEYPATDWQRGTVWVFFGAFVGLMVNRVVQRSRRLRRELERNVQQTETILETMSEGLVVVDAEGSVLLANPAADGFFGSVSQGVPAELPFDRALRGEHIDEEVVVENDLHPSGLHMRLSAHPLRTRSGAITGALVSAHDLSETRRLQRYVEAQRAVMHELALVADVEAALTAALQQLVEQLAWPDLACYWAVEDDALRCEAGWAAAELGPDGPAFLEVSRSLGFASGEGLAGRAWARGEPVSMTVADAREESDAPRLPVSERAGFLTGVAFPVLSGLETMGVIELFSRLPAPERELSDLMTTLGRDIGNYLARRRAEAQEQILKDQFVSLVSHELRTPLTSILGYLDLLGETVESVDDRSERYVRVVTRNAERLKHLVDDLLFLAQVEAGRFDLDLAELDLADLAAAEVEAVRPEAAAKDIDLRLLSEAVPAVRGDRMRLAQMLGNLIANALKFTEEDGSVEVRVRQEDGSVRLEIADTGIGIPLDEQERIGERFFRSSLANDAAIGGTGLGMAIVQTIVAAHGGGFELDSEPGEGTTVAVVLPVEPPSRDERSG